MQLVTSVGELAITLREQRHGAGSLGLVPTMGALHSGHRSLIEQSRSRDDVVAISIFVNPWQFNNPSDFTHYPRSLEVDLEMAEAAGVDVVFAPSLEEMYPGGEPVLWVDPGVLGSGLEGASRPGHFAGVATVVAKLFAIFAPTHAYFGEKDYEQLHLIRRLVLDLSFGAEIVACPTVREIDGLALSSRNARLSPEQRFSAPIIYQALLVGHQALESGATLESATAQMRMRIAGEPSCALVYAEIRDAATLEPPGLNSVALRLLIAATFGEVRLIDNLGFEVKPAKV